MLSLDSFGRLRTGCQIQTKSGRQTQVVRNPHRAILDPLRLTLRIFTPKSSVIYFTEFARETTTRKFRANR